MGQVLRISGFGATRRSDTADLVVGLPAGLIAGRVLQLLGPVCRSVTKQFVYQTESAGPVPVGDSARSAWRWQSAMEILRAWPTRGIASGFDVAGGCLLVLLVTQQWRTRQPSSLSAIGSVVVCLIASWMVSDHLPHEPKRLDARQSIQWKQLSDT